jgi:hypothetical protein
MELPKLSVMMGTLMLILDKQTAPYAQLDTRALIQQLQDALAVTIKALLGLGLAWNALLAITALIHILHYRAPMEPIMMSLKELHAKPALSMLIAQIKRLLLLAATPVNITMDLGHASLVMTNIFAQEMLTQ